MSLCKQTRMTSFINPTATVEIVKAGAQDVWEQLGPGMSEAVYQRALCVYLQDKGVRHAAEQSVPIMYRGMNVGTCRADVITVDIVIELKVAPALKDEHRAQLQKYLTHLPRKVGMLVNFPVRRPSDTPDIEVVDLRGD